MEEGEITDESDMGETLAEVSWVRLFIFIIMRILASQHRQIGPYARIAASGDLSMGKCPAFYPSICQCQSLFHIAQLFGDIPH